MVKLMGGTALAALALSQTAFAGGVERSPQSTAILFEEGNYAEFTYSSVDPKVTGVAADFPFGGFESGDMSPSYENMTFGLKFALSEKFNIAFTHDTPVGADVFYPTGTNYVFQGGNADLNSSALNLYLSYDLGSNFSVHGGLRRVTLGGDLGIPVFDNYTLSVEDKTEIGHSIGFAWEKPEIAARVALTYHSATTHTLNSFESADGTGNIAIPTGQFDVTLPKAINLEFQSGIAADTLLFGSVRWVNWSVFDITPPLFDDALVDYEDNRTTYNIGIGRRLNENWSIAATLGYEETLGGYTGNLGPTDGFKSLGIGATYTNDKLKVTGGIRHIWIGEAQTRGVVQDTVFDLGTFEDNTAWAWGLKVGYYF